MSPTQVTQEKISAYLATSYSVQIGKEQLVLKIGEASPALVDLFAATRTSGAAYLTAFNPHGTMQSDSDNVQANAHLMNAIRQAGYSFFEGSSRADQGDWPAEVSYLILGLTLDDAKHLGTSYRQDALLWAGPDGVPELIVLR